jgi:hypothetical protein
MWLTTIVDEYCGMGRGVAASLPSFALQWAVTALEDPVADPLLRDPVMVDLNINENFWAHLNAALAELWLSPTKFSLTKKSSTEGSYLDMSAKIKVFSVFLQFAHCHIAQTQYACYCRLQAESKMRPEPAANLWGVTAGQLKLTGPEKRALSMSDNGQRIEGGDRVGALGSGTAQGSSSSSSSSSSSNSSDISSSSSSTTSVAMNDSSGNGLADEASGAVAAPAAGKSDSGAGNAAEEPASKEPVETPCNRLNVIGVITADGSFSPRERVELPAVPLWAKTSISKYAQRWGVPEQLGVVYRAFMSSKGDEEAYSANLASDISEKSE